METHQCIVVWDERYRAISDKFLAVGDSEGMLSFCEIKYSAQGRAGIENVAAIFVQWWHWWHWWQKGDIERECSSWLCNALVVVAAQVD